MLGGINYLHAKFQINIFKKKHMKAHFTKCVVLWNLLEVKLCLKILFYEVWLPLPYTICCFFTSKFLPLLTAMRPSENWKISWLQFPPSDTLLVSLLKFLLYSPLTPKLLILPLCLSPHLSFSIIISSCPSMPLSPIWQLDGFATLDSNPNPVYLNFTSTNILAIWNSPSTLFHYHSSIFVLIFS